MADLVNGSVKQFNGTKGYGFIEKEDGNDIFVHYTSLQCEGYRTLQEGQNVEFSVVDGNKGLTAQDVIVL